MKYQYLQQVSLLKQKHNKIKIVKNIHRVILKKNLVDYVLHHLHLMHHQLIIVLINVKMKH